MFSLLVVFNAAAGTTKKEFYTYNVTTHPSVLHVPIGDQTGNISYWSKTDIKNDNKTMQCNPTDPGFCFFSYKIDLPWVSRKLTSDSRYVEVVTVSTNLLNLADACTTSHKLEPQTGAQAGDCAAYYKAYSGKSCNIAKNSSANYAIERIQGKSSLTTKLYPDCYSLISNYGCLANHPNFKYMTTIAKVGDKIQNDIHFQEVYLNVRVCRSFAEKLYDKCRYAGSISDDSVAYADRWIVEPGMGKDDFYKKLRIFWFNQSDPEQKDYPGVNCWSPSSSDQTSFDDVAK